MEGWKAAWLPQCVEGLLEAGIGGGFGWLFEFELQLADRGPGV